MDESESNREVALDSFLAAAGQSLTDAQGSLTEGLGLSANLVLSQAQLEVKAAVSADDERGMALKTISAKDISQGGIDPRLVSSLNFNFVATAGEAAPRGPSRTPAEVVDEVKNRSAVVAMEKILGNFNYEATFVSDKKRWLVTVRDPEGRLVRESVLPD